MLKNPGKKLEIIYKGNRYLRIPIRTKLITEKDDILEIIKEYVIDKIKEKDILFISEKVVAITQNRIIKISDVKPSKIAVFLSKRVTKNPAGIGVSIPETMEMAIKEVGILRILIAAFFSAITKPFGIKGVFYKIAGRKVAGIDGPCEYTIPPYNQYISLIPLDCDKICSKIEKKFGVKACIVDANDLGVEVLGASKGIDKKMIKEILQDNPLGQSNEQTPIGIIRKS